MPCFTSPVAGAGRGRTDDSYISFILSVACTMAYTMGSGADRKRDHYAFGKRNTRPLQMLLGRELCVRGAGASRSGLTGATRHGLSLDAGLRKHAEKLEQDGGRRPAVDAACVTCARELVD